MHTTMKKSGNVEKNLCPCLDCRNLSHQYEKVVVEHLIIRGMDRVYKTSRWYCHGEHINISTDFKFDDIYDLFEAIDYENEDFINYTFSDDDKDEDKELGRSKIPVVC